MTKRGGTRRRGTARAGSTSRAARLIERLRLDHQRIRALLQLLGERPEDAATDDALLEPALVARDVLHYMHRHVDPAHHALEEQLLGLVRGREPPLDARIDALEQQHRESGAEGIAILAQLDAALGSANGAASAEPLQATASYAGRMLVHLAYEEQFVLDRLAALLEGIPGATLPAAGTDPLFEATENGAYAALYAHYLHRIERIRNHASVLDSVPLDPLVEALGLIAEQLSVYAGLLRKQHSERTAACKRHARSFRNAPFYRKPVVAVSAIGAETARALRQQRELLHEIFVSRYGTVASVRDFLHYVGRRFGRKSARRAPATR